MGAFWLRLLCARVADVLAVLLCERSVRIDRKRGDRRGKGVARKIKSIWRKLRRLVRLRWAFWRLSPTALDPRG